MEEAGEKDLLFLKKKKQKDFCPCLVATADPKRVTVFWFFFSKKNALLSKGR